MVPLVAFFFLRLVERLHEKGNGNIFCLYFPHIFTSMHSPSTSLQDAAPEPPCSSRSQITDCACFLTCMGIPISPFPSGGVEEAAPIELPDRKVRVAPRDVGSEAQERGKK